MGGIVSPGNPVCNPSRRSNEISFSPWAGLLAAGDRVILPGPSCNSVSFSRRSSWSFVYRSTHTPPEQRKVFGVRDLSPVGSPRRGTTFYDERLTRHVPLSFPTLEFNQMRGSCSVRWKSTSQSLSFDEHARG